MSRIHCRGGVGGGKRVRQTFKKVPGDIVGKVDGVGR